MQTLKTTLEAALILGVTQRTVQHHIESGNITAQHYGRAFLIEEAELSRYAARRGKRGPRRTTPPQEIAVVAAQEITRADIVRAFTSAPGRTDPMRTEELVARLDIIIGTLRKDKANPDSNHPLSVSAANTLRGALIRLAQAYGDKTVLAKVDELTTITCDITGI